MLDIRWIRENPEVLDQALRNRGAEPAAGRLIALDEARRAAVQTLQDMQTRRNAASREIGQAKAQKDEARAKALMEEVAGLKEKMAAAQEEERAVDKALHDALAEIPNVPLDEVPVGPDESANREERKWGEPKRTNSAKEHYELGEALGLMDFETAAKLSGSRFVVLKGQLARMERALGQFMLDLHTTEHRYTEVQPPLLVRDEVLFGTGQLPKFREDQFTTSMEEIVGRDEYDIRSGDTADYRIEFKGARKVALEEAFRNAGGRIKGYFVGTGTFTEVFRPILETSRWLIPTAEVPLTNLVRESITPEDQLPLRFTALTPCFRSEAGSAGKDTRGMLRQHQFDKVELVSITTPEKSLEEHERMTTCAEEVLKQLDLAYRVVTLSTGDMGFGARKTYDIEVWLPGQKAYREISSCSVCGDFQARRMDARYRKEGGKAPWPFVHTLNGSGVAVGRALIAVMETYQNEDGSITVPEVLRPYMGGLEKVGG
jgi:seryl-tRNA synthetase